jgi:hypothetical protein
MGSGEIGELGFFEVVDMGFDFVQFMIVEDLLMFQLLFDGKLLLFKLKEFLNLVDFEVLNLLLEKVDDLVEFEGVKLFFE